MVGEGGVGISCMYLYKLKSVGNKTEPWGTPFVKFLVLDVAPLYVTDPFLPER